MTCHGNFDDWDIRRRACATVTGSRVVIEKFHDRTRKLCDISLDMFKMLIDNNYISPVEE